MESSLSTVKTTEYTIFPAFEKDNVPIIFACDDNYIPITTVMLSSLLKNASSKFNYDLLFFHQNVTEFHREEIKALTTEFSNVSIRFIDLSDIIKKFDLRVKRYYSIEIYFRLFMPYLLTNYDKAIYLDCDLIVLGDISKLFSEDIGTNLVAAVRDIGMILHYYTSGKKYIPSEYFENELMGITPDNYFNSGVLVFNLKTFQHTYTLEQVFDLIQQENWHFPDQDVLNILCANKTFFLPAQWNVVPESPGNRTVANIEKDVPNILAKEYIEARKNPLIVHYALKEKPWLYTDALDPYLYRKFWEFASKTKYFYDLLLKKQNIYGLGNTLAVIQDILHSEVNYIYGRDNIHLAHNNYYLGNVKTIPVRYECATFTKNSVILEAFTSLPSEYFTKDLEIYFVNNKQYIKCNIFPRKVQTRYQNENLNINIGFSAEIPLNMETASKIDIVFRIHNIMIPKIKVNYSRLFPVDRLYNNQYYASNSYLMTISKPSLCIKYCDHKDLHRAEKQFIKTLLKSKRKYDFKAIYVRKMYQILNHFKRKPLWLIQDNFLADDNGMAFFNFLNHNKEKQCNVFFVMSQNNPKYAQIKKTGRVVAIESRKFKWLSLFADCLISSVIDEKFRNPFAKSYNAYRNILQKRKFIFLQHGVITQDLSSEHNKYHYNPAGFLTSAYPEYESLISGNYFYTPNEVWLTGLPRFDLLYHDEKKYITVMPTWRKHLRLSSAPYEVVANFTESCFYKFYDALLNNENLINYLEEKGYRLCLCMHPLLKKSVPLFQHENSRFLVLDDKYRDVFAWSNLIISDYSSAIFDFLYLKKPIIYAHSDREEFFSNHVYSKGYLDYETQGFGEVEYDLNGTITRIMEYVENGCTLKDLYRNRIERFFAYNDQNNCRRVYERILSASSNMQN